MKNGIRTVLTTLILIAAILSCNMPATEPVPPPSDVQTSAALTVEALLMPPTVTATVKQGDQAAITNTPSPTVGPTGTITPTYSVPMLRVLQQTNCRKGPGQEYEVVYTYLAWKELEIVGAYPQDNYWLVKSTESPTGECWLWGEYVEVTGSYWVVSSVTPPPPATIPPPQAPAPEWEYFCSYADNTVEVSLNWADVANNETGYRIIRNGQVVAELPANTTSYTETIDLKAGEKIVYEVEVFNNTGPKRSSPISFEC